MKTITTLLCTLLGLSFALRVSDAAAQAPSGRVPIDVAKEKYRKAEQRAKGFLDTIQRTLGEDAGEQQELRGKLRPLVEESFDARLQLQQAEIAELRRRLAEIERAVDQREKHRDAIVEARVDELLLGPTGQAVTRIQALEAGEVAGIMPGRSGYTLRAGDKVKAEDLLAEIKSPDGSVKIHSPIDGVIVERNVNVGDVVKPGDTLFQISSAIAGKAAADKTAAGGSPAALGKSKSPPSVEKPAHEALMSEEFDLETRERLAQLDLQAAEEDYVAAEKELSVVKAAYDVGTATAEKLVPRENAHRHAALEIQRAKVRLDGLKRLRAELEAAADAALAEAEGEQQRAAAKVRTSEAELDASKQQVITAEAEVAKASANQVYREKQYQRVKALFETKSVDEKLMDESEEALNSAKATLAAAKSGDATAMAQVEQAKSAIDEARAELKVAEARLRAAQVQRDRMLHHDVSDNAGGKTFLRRETEVKANDAKQ